MYDSYDKITKINFNYETTQRSIASTNRNKYKRQTCGLVWYITGITDKSIGKLDGNT